MTCEAELCPNWTGQGCICEVLGLEPEPQEVVPCEWNWYSGYHVPEYCDEDSVPGERYCRAHLAHEEGE